jgi:DNA mismatch repair protein MutS
VSEHIHDHVKCKTIFATHYHELTQLSDELPALRNFNVAVREIGDEVLFLHRLQPGGADRSYGIEVGRLAGLPSEVIARARTVLRSLEGEQLAAALEAGSTRRRYSCDDRDIQLGLFARSADAVVRRLLALDLNTLTPLDALKVLDELCRDARQK